MTLSPHGKLIPRGELCPMCRKRRRLSRSEYCTVCEPKSRWPLCGRCRVHRREPGASYCPACVIAVAYIAYPPPAPRMRYSDVVITAADRWLREHVKASDPDYEQRRAARLQFLQRKHERQRTARIKLLLSKK